MFELVSDIVFNNMIWFANQVGDLGFREKENRGTVNPIDQGGGGRSASIVFNQGKKQTWVLKGPKSAGFYRVMMCLKVLRSSI